MFRTGATTAFLMGATIITGLVLAGIYVFADNSVDDVVITVPVSCTLSGSGMNTHNATINNGQYNSSIGETTIKVLCNDSEGFAIYTIGYTDNTDGINVLTNSTLGSAYDITTGTQTSGANSKWAMKLSANSGQTYPVTIENSFNNFHNVPDDYTLVASRASGTDIGSSAVGSTITTTYQAYISPTQAAGTYTGQVKYTLVHPNDADAPERPFMCPANHICYHPNGNDVAGSMDIEYVWAYYEYEEYGDGIGRQPVRSNSEVVLVPPNYSRSGYGFESWNTAENGTGIDYGPSQFITTGDLSHAGLNLYAKWVPAETNVTMQTFDSSILPYSSASTGTVIGLTDARDNNVYAVAKMMDDKWWMIENLRLDPGTANITSANTNNPTSLFLSGLNNASSSDVWCDDDSDANCTDRVLYNTANLNRSLDPDVNNHYDENWESENASWYSYGVYYNWYTATAGHGNATFSEDVGAYICDDYFWETNCYYYSPSTPGDICPSSWRLPPAEDGNSVARHVTAVPGSVMYLVNLAYEGERNAIEYPFNYVTSGYYNLTIQDDRGSDPYSSFHQWWTSTIGVDYDGYPGAISIYSGNNSVFELNNGRPVIYGLPIRCVMQ